MLIKMLEIIIKIVSLLFVLLGIILIYDARIVTKRFFSFGDQNDATQGLKILGFIIAIIGGLVVYFNL